MDVDVIVVGHTNIFRGEVRVVPAMRRFAAGEARVNCVADASE